MEHGNTGRTTWIIYMVLAAAAAANQESFNTTPPPVTSDFSCSGRQMGFYADESTNCRAYHMCDDHGNHFTHYCPEDTAFRQDAMVCDHAYLVDCQASINSTPLRSRIDLDDNHDAPPSSFVEPRGEGTNAKGYARSFRINPDSKNNANSKYPTFVLNSSVFLKNRDSGVGRSIDTGKRFRDSHEDFSRIDRQQKIIPANHKEESPSPFQSREALTRNSMSTTPRTTISENLQPPLESPRISNIFDDFETDEFSFLVPPDVRDDNLHYQKDTFESMKNDKSELFNRDTFDSFKSSDSNESFEKISVAPVTFSPRTKMVLGMVKARGLASDSDSSFNIPKPVNFLEPPIFKPESTPFARSNFNFHNDDYPYVETLRSIQNNKPTTSSFSSSPLTRSTTPNAAKLVVTEATIFPVPNKQLVPSGEVELDPYYPKNPSTTEAYYTPRQQVEKSRKPHFTTTRRPSVNSAKFEIPAVLPDLNSLEDLLDRRKLFFIPQLKSV